MNQVIPSEWQRAVTVFILKELNSTTTSQLRSIALLNVEGKIFFSILAKRLTSYLTSNGYIDTSCQKAGVPGFPGCVEHSAAIREQIQTAKRERELTCMSYGSTSAMHTGPSPTNSSSMPWTSSTSLSALEPWWPSNLRTSRCAAPIKASLQAGNCCK